MVSKKLKHAVKLSDLKAYEIALRSGMHPSMLSKLLHGAEPVKNKDPRVIAVGRVLGIPPTECISEQDGGNESGH